MNPKIERVLTEIDRAKGKIVGLQTRLRDLEKQKTNLENEEIVALFRREKLSEDEFSALLRTQRKGAGSVNGSVVRENLDMEDGSGDEDE